MNITVNAFGAVIKTEGEAVAYDSGEVVVHEVVEDCLECERDVEFGDGSYDSELDDA